MGTFEVYEDKAGKWRFRLTDVDGVVVARGEAYETIDAAKAGCALVQRAAADAAVTEV